jgi:hypothetical protein
MCKVGIIDYSVSDKYGGGSDSGDKGRGKRGRKEERKRKK